MDSTCLVPTVKHGGGGGGVMVWGCFAVDTVGDLFKIEGILNQHGYHSILQRHAIPSGLHLVGPSFIFQQDNDSKHTSRLCKGYLTKKEGDGVLRQMTWPPQSPDLNPSEMVWGDLDRRVNAKRPTSAKHLWELLQDCWKTIPGDYLLKLIKRIPRVCKAVIKAKVLLLFICPTLIKSKEIKYIARSSHVTFDFGPCARNQVFKLQYGGATAYIPCDSSPQIPHRWEDRISIDKTTGSITLHNVTRSDAGNYTLVRTNGNGEKGKLAGDSIWIHELFHNYTDGTISLSRCHAEDSGVIIWTIDGRDLLDQRWLSPDNRTLIIPYNHTGVITVSNPVSADNKSITVIKDLNGEPGHLGHVMGLNVIRLIWGDGGDEPTIGALLLPRNISTIYILLTPSGKSMVRLILQE
ncbi:unnamed protein product [Ranitomeya imitator]|uniref:Tc1-like transposase DDE domain-containing protein n=1 Tax=Ranitomeya imitator TaxID=111125 RepID=A0ABN9LV08_9NEOB|nr:unnamed protein product [Ranitomeya imitator]